MSKGFSWRWLLIGVALVSTILAIRIASSDTLTVTLPNQLQDFITLTVSIIIESFPFVLLGIFLSVAVQLWVPARFFTRLMPKKGLLRRLYVSCFGMFLPVCECGNLPLARGLVARGFSPSESLTFLLAAPILNPITLVTTSQAFPAEPHILIARALGALLIANIVGWLFSRKRDQQDMLVPAFAAYCKQPAAEDHTHGRSQKSFELFASELGKIIPALCIGAGVAGGIQAAVPRDVLLSLGSNPVIAIGVMMALAFIIAICSNVDAFFALAFSSTFGAGAIVAFLVFGPMIDIKMLGLMRTTFRLSVLVQVTAVVALLTAALGLGVSYAF